MQLWLLCSFLFIFRGVQAEQAMRNPFMFSSSCAQPITPCKEVIQEQIPLPEQVTSSWNVVHMTTGSVVMQHHDGTIRVISCAADYNEKD